jgi:hypothetical protein
MRNRHRGAGSGLLLVRTLKAEPVFVVLGVEMRATNAIDLACLKSAPQDSNENVYSLSLKQDESSRLRRIENLKHENALLMRMV